MILTSYTQYGGRSLLQGLSLVAPAVQGLSDPFVVLGGGQGVQKWMGLWE